MHVTVLMGVYNAQRFVRDAIESILGQSHTDWDLLVIDDGSIDGTWELLRSISQRDSRVTIERNDRNRGLAASLNRGWRQTRSDLIARMDADDVSLPERLHRQVEFMRAHPEVAVLGTAAEILDEAGQCTGSAFRPAEHEVLVSRIYKESPFFHPTVMLRRTFIEALGGYDERLRRSQDYDLWLRGYRTYRYANLQEALIRYRVRRVPSWKTIFCGMYALGRSGWRDKHVYAASWCALRFGLAGIVRKTGLYRPNL